VARRAGYRVGLEFVSPADTPDISHWEGGALAGLLILGGGDLSRDWVQAAIESSLPVVVVDHFIPAMELPAVVPDNFAGAYAATQHLLDMGHTRIGFIRGPSKYWTLGERQAGYMLAMQRAVEGLKLKPGIVLIDGNRMPRLSIPARTIVKGDAKVRCISAASILAKVARDEAMLKYHEQFPNYGFADNKGYLTEFHLATLKEFGPCPVHRKHYAPVRALLEGAEPGEINLELLMGDELAAQLSSNKVGTGPERA